MRVLVAAALVVASAAAPAQGVRISMHAWPEPVLLDTLRQEHALKAAPEQVYDAVHRAFADLDLPVGRTDNRAGIIGSERFERTHNLAGAPMSRSFDCGEGALGPYADTFRLEIAVVAWVKPGPAGGTILALATIASARDISGTSRNPRVCASTGTLEGKILERVTKLVGG